jgi:hypothetical protein
MKNSIEERFTNILKNARKSLKNDNKNINVLTHALRGGIL